MADSEEWLVGEDGCLSVGQPTDSVTYHSTLNTILVVTKEPAVKVLDATSGSVLQSSNVSGMRELFRLGDSFHGQWLLTLRNEFNFASFTRSAQHSDYVLLQYVYFVKLLGTFFI